MRMPKLERSWTVDEVHALPDDGNRYEVIDGELFVTPAPSLNHQNAAFELCRIFQEYLKHQRIGHAYIAPADVTFSPRRLVQPDVFVVPLVDGRRPRRFEDAGRLLLAAEILSPSTARADRITKRELFRGEGVPEYWVVDLDARAIERSTPVDPRVDIFAETIEWHTHGAAMPLAIDLVDYFARVLDD